MTESSPMGIVISCVSGLAVTAAVATIGVLPGAADGNTATVTQTPTYLFAINSRAGTITGIGKDTGKKRMTLTLRGVSHHATQFADRPFRQAFVLRTRELVSQWDRWFEQNPPNAVLTFATSKDSMPHSIVVLLKHPRFDRKADTLTFAAWHIHRKPTPSPDGKRPLSLPARRPPRLFSGGSLFIDAVEVPVRWGEVVSGCEIKYYTSCPGANFAQAYLGGAPLADAELNGANFFMANAQDAMFEYAHLAGADFSRANLRGANLRSADLTGANLQEADLSRATWTDGRYCQVDMNAGWVFSAEGRPLYWKGSGTCL